MVQSNADMGLKMQVVLFSVLLQALDLVQCQIWSDSNSGIMVKTLYLPLRKGGSSISLQDLGSARHLTTFNIPALPLRQSSDVLPSLNQNYQHKTKEQDALSNQLQDARPKTNGYMKPGNTHLQVSNYQAPYYAPAHHQPAYSNVQQQSNAHPASPSVEPQNQLYQPQHYPSQQNLQTIQHSAYPSVQHASNGGHSPAQNADGSTSYGHSNVNLSEQLYTANSYVPQKKPVSNTQLYSVQSHQPTYAQSYSSPSNHQIQYGSVSNNQPTQYGSVSSNQPTQYGSVSSNQPTQYGSVSSNQPTQYGSVSSNQPTQYGSVSSSHQAQYGSVSSHHDVATAPQKSTATFAGESSRFARQMLTETQPTHSSVLTNSFVQRPLPVLNHQQYGYAQQDTSTNQQAEHIYSSNQYQAPQAYDKRQLVTSSNQQIAQQQPLTSTYAIVHQKIPTNNYISQDVSTPYQQAEYTHGSSVKPADYVHGYSVKQADYVHGSSVKQPEYVHGSSVKQPDYVHGSNSKQASDGLTGSSRANIADSRLVEYVKITTLPDNSNHLASNHLSNENTQIYPELSQQPPKKDVYESNKNQAYPATAKVHMLMPQYSTLQDSLSNGQYVGQQPSSSGYQVVQSYDTRVKPAQHQSSAQSVYPDPSSETYYPENSQVYIAPPQGYPSQGQSPLQHQQTQSNSEQNQVSKYASNRDVNVHYNQRPVSMQSEQLGIHIAIPNNY